MKSERRHELQHNDLATWLLKTGESLQRHQNAILAVVIVLLAAYVIHWWWAGTAAEQNAEAWNGVAVGAMNPRQNAQVLKNVMEKFPNTLAAETAQVVLADAYLINACDLRFKDRDSAYGEFKNADEGYDSAARQTRDSLLKERAMFGQALAQESLGNLGESVKIYEMVAATWPNGAYAEAATRQAKFLGLQETKKMFDALRKFEPKPVVTKDVAEPGKRPSTLPQEGSISPEKNTTPAADKKSDDKKTTEKKTDAKASAGAEKNK